MSQTRHKPSPEPPSVVGIPTWLMSVIVAAMLTWSAGGAWLGIEMYASLNTLTDRVNRFSEYKYVTSERLRDQLSGRDDKIADLYSRYRDLRAQMRYYHGQSPRDATLIVPFPNPLPPQSLLAWLPAIHDKRLSPVRPL